MHWPLCGVASICRSRAFISARLSRRPARTLPWQASVAQTRCSAARRLAAWSSVAEILGQIAHQRADLGAAEQRRQLAHQHRVAAEALQHQAELGELGAALVQALRGGRVELDHLGQQQALAGDPARRERRLHALVDQPLVGGMLVDQHHAVAGLGEDVGVMQLRARRAQRMALERLVLSGGRARVAAPPAVRARSACPLPAGSGA